MCLARRRIAANSRAPNPARQPEHGRAREIDERERRRAVHREQRRGAVDRDQREVAGRRRDQRGEQHPPRQLLLERHLDREDRAGGRGLEDRRDARGRAGDEQQVGVGTDEERSPAPLQRRPDRRTEIDRRALRAPSRSRCRASRPRRPCGEPCRARRDRGARGTPAGTRRPSSARARGPGSAATSPRPRARLPDANAMSHNGRCATPRSNTTSTVRRSKPATATPVIAPTTADASTT